MDSEDVDRLLELTPDNGPSPEAIFSSKERWRRAWAGIKEPDVFEAMVLHYHDGVPIVSRDPKKPDLAGLLGLNEDQVEYLLRKGRRQMREALGEEK